MSNLQEVPLAEPEVLSAVPSALSDQQPAKSSSLKRFFKVSKKPHMRDHLDEDSDASSSDEAVKEKPKTLGRFFMRNRGASKAHVPDSSSNLTNTKSEHERPVPNVKPTIKASISTYWKLLFHRQKANRQDMGAMADEANAQQEEVHELQPVQLPESPSVAIVQMETINEIEPKRESYSVQKVEAEGQDKDKEDKGKDKGKEKDKGKDKGEPKAQSQPQFQAQTQALAEPISVEKPKPLASEEISVALAGGQSPATALESVTSNFVNQFL